MVDLSQHQSTRTPAPYGRTCVNCARAKCRCILLAAGGGCERCHRLKKDCQPSQSVRKRNSKRSSASRTAQLEAKLDSIVSMLQSNELPASLPGNLKPAGAMNGLSPAGSQHAMGSLHPNSQNQHVISPPTTDPGASPSAITDFSVPAIHPDDAESFLSTFRSQYLQFFPIAHIPPHTTSQELQQEKPFFWLCIMAVSTKVLVVQEALFKKIQHTLYQQVLVDHESSIDMLLGVLTYISWVSYSRKPFVSFYSHIAMGIICDLGINKAIPKEQPSLHAFKCSAGIKPHVSTTRTLEERRAVLACFLMTSSVSLSVMKIDALRWTPHMDESLSILADADQCPEDALLISLVKIQLVLDKVHHLIRDGDGDNVTTAFHTRAFKAQLDKARSKIPLHLQQHRTVLLHLANAEILINEANINKVPVLNNAPDLYRLEGLYKSLHAAKAWIDIWLSIPYAEYLSIPFQLFSQYTRILVNLYKLSTLEDPSWDLNAVRNTVNLIDVLDRMLHDTKKASELYDPHDSLMFAKGVRMITCLKQNWEEKLRKGAGAEFPRVQPDAGGGELIQPSPTMSGLFSMDGVDDAWMVDIFGSL